MAIACNEIHTVATELKDRFTPCYALTADDMDTLVELIEAVETCVTTGTGFMTTSVYDTNINGIVDDSELVNGLTVQTAVPGGAVFTDTIYDDSGVEPSLGFPTINGQVLSSTTAGIRSWVNTIAGGGDMLVSVYDTNGNNVVDNSELVNGLTVQTAVPGGAVFTDTIYDDTAIQLSIAGKEDSLLNPGVNGYLLSSDTLGNRSWVVPPTGITNLTFTPSPVSGTIVSSSGTDASIPLANATNAGLLSPVYFTLLGNQSGINTGDSPTNLAYTQNSAKGTITSSDGTDAIIPLADNSIAGLLSPSDFVVIGNQTGVNTGDQIETDPIWVAEEANVPRLDSTNSFLYTNTFLTSIKVGEIGINYYASNWTDNCRVYADSGKNLYFSWFNGGDMRINATSIAFYGDPGSYKIGLLDSDTSMGFSSDYIAKYKFISTQGTLYLEKDDLTVSDDYIPTKPWVRQYVTNYPSINIQTGTIYSVVTTDKNKMITLDNAAAITLTVPDTLGFSDGSEVHILQKGTGQVTVVAGGTVTLNTHASDTSKLDGQYSIATLKQIGSNTWVLFGRLQLV